MILACLFSTLDNVVTLSNAHGTIAVQTWPRLFLAASGLAAGLIFDLAERRYMGLVMLGIAVLSTISILAVEAGADPNLGLVVFYLSSGFFVTFFTATFTQLAPRMHAPALWAGMGRAANNVCAFTTSGLSLALVTSDNVALIMIGALVLLVAACAAFVAAGLFRLPQTEQEREREQLAKEALAAPTIEEQRQAFIADHALTPREVDVLIAVTQDERPLKQVAEELGISMRMVQRHLSSIYQKTDTQTRAGLAKAFPSAKNKNHHKGPLCGGLSGAEGHSASLSQSVTDRPLKAGLLLQIETVKGHEAILRSNDPLVKRCDISAKAWQCKLKTSL